MTVRYTIEAKPTTYKGVNFRSRLEARWAVYFDMQEVKWVYEPIDFGSWSPDFLLEKGANKCQEYAWAYRECYVEIKPITKFDQDTGDKITKSPAGLVCLFGLTPNHRWFNSKGWWDETASIPNMSLWDEAGNVVQWQHN